MKSRPFSGRNFIISFLYDRMYFSSFAFCFCAKSFSNNSRYCFYNSLNPFFDSPNGSIHSWTLGAVNKNYLHQATQSDPDSQTNPHQAHNTWRRCHAAPSHGRHTGSAGGRVGKRYPLPWFPLPDDPSRNNPQTTRDCHPYRSSYAGCQCDRSGSSGFVVGFLRLLRPPKAQNAELSNQSEKHPSGLFAEPNLFTLEQYRLLIIFIHP